MLYLGKKWNDVRNMLEQNGIAHTTEMTMPAGKATPEGDLRVARVCTADGALKFILLHERFNL